MAANLFIHMGLATGVWVLIVILVIVGLCALALALQYRKAGPNEVLIISGGKRQTVTDPDGTVRTIGYRTHIGGGTFVIPLVEKAQIMPIEMLTIRIETPEVFTARGVPLMVEATAQVRIRTDEHSLRLAAEQFLSKGPDGIKRITSEIIDGSVRGVLGTMDVEEMYRDQRGFAEKVSAMVGPEFTNMGLALVSFAVTSIKDTQGFLESLGKPRIAQVKRDATVAEAEAEKEAAMKSAAARKESEIARLKGEVEISEAQRDFETQKALHEVTVNENRAKADLAYDLERHRLEQALKREEYKVKIVEKEQATILSERESQRMEKELEANVRKPAEARKFEAQMQAEAEAYRIRKEAEAKAEAARIEGAVDSELLKERGAAEAEAMRKKAESWRGYTQAAVVETLLARLPELAQAIAQPLSKVDRITLVNAGGEEGTGASRITGEVAKILAQVPEVVESLSGVDLKALVKNLPSAGDQGAEAAKGAGGAADGEGAPKGKEPSRGGGKAKGEGSKGASRSRRRG